MDRVSVLDRVARAARHTPGVRHYLPASFQRIVPPGAPTPRVAIVGAGFSGLGMAIRLRRSGIDTFTIFERDERLGGTWRDNTYPGAACDVPSHLYSFSFASKRDWTRKYAEQPEILGYLEWCADAFDVRRFIRFGAEVAGAEWDGERACWRIRLASGEEHEADVLIAATGQLNHPSIPDIPGLDGFAGTAFHSARWNHDHDLAGDDVAVIGNGASAIQFVPHVAERARSVTIFQRSTNYVTPKSDGPFSRRARWAFTHVPALHRLYRWSIYWRLEARFVVFRRDGRLGARLRAKFADGLAPLVSERLSAEALLPDYPIGCKRILISNDWYPTLLRPNVRTVTAPIERVTADAVHTADGAVHHADTIIFGTGFEATRFLGPMEVAGVDGRKLADAWADGAQAYLGMTVAGFPNFFLLYGPNTNLGHNSILVMVERQIEYVLRCLEEMLARDVAALEVKPAAYASDTAATQRALSRTVWAAACKSWYKTASGRITQNWPGFTVQYWARTLRPRFDDYVARRRA